MGETNTATAPRASVQSSAGDEDLIQLIDMHKWYGDFHVLKNINLTVKRGERIVVCGPSGSGKSTMIRCINRLEEHQQGQIIVDGIHYLRSVQGDPPDPSIFLKQNLFHTYPQSLTALTSRNSSRPQAPPSRPLPDCFIPPKGEPAPLNLPFISTIPDLSCRATRRARALFEVCT